MGTPLTNLKHDKHHEKETILKGRHK